MNDAITNSLPSILIALAVLAILAFALYAMYRQKRSGKGCCSCGGSCSGCSGACHCESPESGASPSQLRYIPDRLLPTHNFWYYSTGLMLCKQKFLWQKGGS